MIKFVLGKTTFSPQYPVSYYINNEKLLGISEIIDPLVIEYIQSITLLIEKVINQVPGAEFSVVDDPNDIELFSILPFTNEDVWKDFLISSEMINFNNATNKLYPLIGWVDNGFKIVNTLDEPLPLIKTKFEIQKIWNNN